MSTRCQSRSKRDISINASIMRLRPEIYDEAKRIVHEVIEQMHQQFQSIIHLIMVVNLLSYYRNGGYTDESNRQRSERIISVEGAYNVRDLGGYTTKDGERQLGNRSIVRTAVHKLSGESRTHLTDRGIVNVIDLRHAKKWKKRRTYLQKTSV